jgi:serine protease Do
MRQLAFTLVVFLAGWFGAAARQTPIAAAAGGPPDFADVIARADPSVVRVSTRTSREPNRSRDDGVGGGFVVRADGLILTSLHVVAGAQRILVSVPNRGTVDGEVVARDASIDVALLRVPLRQLPPLAFGDPQHVRVGAWVLAAGAPYEMENSWSVGIVSGINRSRVGVRRNSFQDYIQTDAAANLGNSGGPLVDADGRAVGMMTAILSRTGGNQGVALAVPMDAVRASLERMLQPQAARQARLGIRVRELRSRAGGEEGLWVTGFDPGSPAPSAGVQRGDLIVGANGAAVTRTPELQRLLWNHRPGDVLTLTIVRAGRRLSLPVRLR